MRGDIGELHHLQRVEKLAVTDKRDGAACAGGIMDREIGTAGHAEAMEERL